MLFPTNIQVIYFSTSTHPFAHAAERKFDLRNVSQFQLSDGLLFLLYLCARVQVIHKNR
jgi:hypothetical protein